MVIWHAIFRERALLPRCDRLVFMELFRWYMEYTPHRYRICARVYDTCLLALYVGSAVPGCYSVLFFFSFRFIRLPHSHFSRCVLTLCWISHSFAPNPVNLCHCVFLTYLDYVFSIVASSNLLGSRTNILPHIEHGDRCCGYSGYSYIYTNWCYVHTTSASS